MRKSIIIKEAGLPSGFGFNANKPKNTGQNVGGGLPSGFGFKGGNGGNVGAPAAQKELKPKLTHCVSKMVDAPDGSQKEIIEGYLAFIQYNAVQQVCDAINNTIPNIPGKVSIMKAFPTQGKKGAITLKMNPKYIKDIIAKWADELDNIIKQIPGHKTGTIGKQLINQIALCPTQEDIKAMEKSIGTNFLELLKNLQDLKTQNKIFAWQVQNEWVKEYGFLYAISNAMSVQMQAPSASFVTTENGWAEYNRKVKPGAQRIIIQMPNYRWIPKKYKDAAAAKKGYKDWNDAVANLKSVSKQMLHSIEIEASKMMGTNATHPQIVYDVADTIPPANPADDLWANQMGLINNIKGELNQIAQADYDVKNPLDAQKRIAAQKVAQQQQQPAAPANVDIASKRGYAEKRLSILIKRCQDVGIKVPLKSNAVIDKQGIHIDQNVPLDSIESDILNLSYKYGLVKCPEFNILKPDFQNKIAGYVAITIAIASGYSLDSHGLKRFIRPNDLTTQDAAVIFKIATEIIPAMKANFKNENTYVMGKKVIFEDVELGNEGETISFDQFVNMVHQIFGAPEETVMEKKEIKNNFVDIFNRIIK